MSDREDYKIYVGNLSYDVSERQVRQHFGKYGDVDEGKIFEEAWRSLMKMNPNALSMWHNRKFGEFGIFVYALNELYVIYLYIILFIARKCTTIKIVKE